jgi:hypothetical protein
MARQQFDLGWVAVFPRQAPVARGNRGGRTNHAESGEEDFVGDGDARSADPRGGRYRGATDVPR